MLRAAMRLLGILFGFSLVLLVAFGLQEQSRTFPLGTDRMVVLDASAASISKAEMIVQLDELARNDESLLAKPAVSLENEKEYTFFVFGDCVKDSAVPIWSFSKRGVLRCSSEIGDYPVSGTYAYRSGSALEQDIQSWARRVNVSIAYSEQASLRKAILASLESNGMGILLCGTAFALCAVVLAWLAVRADTRRIRHTAGVLPWAIHGRDVWILLAALAPPVILGAVVGSLGVLALTHSWASAAGLLVPAACVLCAALVLLACAFLLMSALAGVGKSLRSMRSAKAYASVRRLGALFRFASIMLVAVALPYAASFSSQAWEKARAVDAWENVGTSVVMNFAGGPDAWDSTARNAGSYVDAADEDGIVYFSTVVDLRQFGFATAGGSSELVIANTAFLDVAVPDWRTERVTELDDDTRAAFIKDFGPQLEIWLRGSSASDLASNLYRATGEGIPAASLTVGQDQRGAVRDAYVLVLDSAAPLSHDFLASGLASHWLFFADKERALKILGGTDFAPALAGTDYVAAEIASASEASRSQAVQGALGAILAIAGAIVISVQGAFSWAQSNRRRIFALRTQGRGELAIARHPVAVDLLVLCAGLIGSYAIGVAVYGLPQAAGGALAIALGLVYLIQTLVSYRHAAGVSFTRSATRTC